MDNKEKIICKADASKIAMHPLAILSFVIAFLGFVASFIVASTYNKSVLNHIFRNFGLYVWFYVGSLLFAGLGVLLVVMLKPELTVTDKRVYGKIGSLKKVDLPINQISAIGNGILNNITISTSSGAIRFWGVANRDEVSGALSQLLAQKQSIPSTQTTIVESASNAEELAKFKKLLDDGIITQEEFDAKKKQLLGL